MRKEDVLKLPSMPAAGPSYPAGPYRFVNREYMVITYETDPQALVADLPEPLESVEHALVHFEWIRMPDSSGFGSYTESGMVIPCRFRGEDVNFGQLVAMGTMGYKHESMAGNGERTTATLSKTQVNLKLIPGVDGEPAICQLVAYNLTEIVIKGSWVGPGRLHLVPHVNAPVADLPVRRIVGAHHFLADLTLPYGRVIYDYLKEA
jgi:acetoacetate decarboxylase